MSILGDAAMDIYSNSITVYESKTLYLTAEEVKLSGYDGKFVDLRNACEKAVSRKIHIYHSNINAYNVNFLEKSNLYEVSYYHIHKFDRVYIEEIIYKHFRPSKLKIDSVYITGNKGITINVRLNTDCWNPDEITSELQIKSLCEKLQEYITVKLVVSIEVMLNGADGESLRFNC